MTDATLGFKIDSSQATAAAANLDKLTAASKRAEQGAANLEAASRKSAIAHINENRAVGENYGIRQQMTQAQVATIKNYETLIGKQALLNTGHAREAAQFMALRKAGVAENTAYGKTVKDLAGTLYDLENANTRVDRSTSSFMNTLTRRFVVAFFVTQIRGMISALVNLNAELAKTGDVGRFTGIGGQGIQGLQSAAAIKGVDQSAFLDQMTKFSREVERAKTGAGDLAALFRVNGQVVGDTASTMSRLADMVARAKNEREKFSILETAGLPATREWVKFLEQGSVAIKRAADEAVKLTNQQLEDAARLEERWNKFWDNWIRRGKMAVLAAFDTSAQEKAYDEMIARRRSAAGATLTRTPIMDGEFSGTFGQPSAKTAITVGPQTVDLAKLRERLGLESQSLALLGQTTTALEARRQVELQLEIAGLNGIKIDRDRAETLKRLAFENNLGITAIKSQTDALNVEAQTFAMGTGQATAYVAFQHQINEARRAGKTLTDENIAAIKTHADALGQAAQRAADMRFSSDMLSGSMRTFRDSLLDGATAWQSFKNAAANALMKISDMLIEMAARQLVANAFGGGGSSIGSMIGAAFGAGPSLGGNLGGTGGALGGLYHAGGIAGRPSQSRYIHPAYFDNAPRYHNGGIAGLKPDEVPAILRKGEPVFRDMNHAREVVGGGVTINMPITIQGDASEKTLAIVRAEFLPRVIAAVQEAQSRRVL